MVFFNPVYRWKVALTLFSSMHRLRGSTGLRKGTCYTVPVSCCLREIGSRARAHDHMMPCWEVRTSLESSFQRFESAPAHISDHLLARHRHPHTDCPGCVRDGSPFLQVHGNTGPDDKLPKLCFSIRHVLGEFAPSRSRQGEYWRPEIPSPWSMRDSEVVFAGVTGRHADLCCRSCR